MYAVIEEIIKLFSRGTAEVKNQNLAEGVVENGWREAERREPV